MGTYLPVFISTGRIPVLISTGRIPVLNCGIHLIIYVFFPVYNTGEFIVQIKEKTITFIMTYKHKTKTHCTLNYNPSLINYIYINDCTIECIKYTYMKVEEVHLIYL